MPVKFDLGILPNQPLSRLSEIVVHAEKRGFSGVWVADSQCVFRDAYMALAHFAAHTRTISLATGVTNIITRHPAVLAHSFATLDELSGGRAILGVGVGESAVFNIGQRPAKLKELEDAIGTMRGLIEGKEVEYRGKTMRLGWSERHVPVVIACTGPKSLQMAGRIADGVLFQVGADPMLVQYALDNIRIGALQVGRNPSDVKLYHRVSCIVDEDPEKARDLARPYTAMAAKTIFSAIPKEAMPEDLWSDLSIMNENYDYQRQGSAHVNQASLVTDQILDALAITGTSAEVRSKFAALHAMGIDHFVIPATVPEPVSLIDALSRHVLERL